jgi:TonB family protein
MDALGSWFAPFWIGMAVHLWQTALFVAALWLIAYALRRTSARVLTGLYWAGVLKLLLPLPLLGPFANRLLESIFGASALVPAGEAGWAKVTVLMYPVLLDPGSAGWVGPPPAAYLAITFVWLAGPGLFFARRLRSDPSRRRLALRRVAQSRGHDAAKLRAAITDAGLHPETVRISSESPGPFVQGGLRPIIVLPDAIVDELDRDELRAVLIHEREHFRRRDPLRYAVLGVVRAVFWFYPPVWWLARRIRETTEMACDDAVVIAGLPAATYCRSLARTLRLGLAHPGATSPVGILGHRVSFLHRRLERIRSGRRFEAMFSHRVTVTAAALAAVVVSMLPMASGDGFGAHAGELTSVNDLDQLAGADVSLVLNFKQARLDAVLELLGEVSAIDFRIVDGIEAKRVDIDTGDGMPLAKILKHLAMTAGLQFRVLGPNEVEVMSILAAGSNGVTMPVLIPESKVSPAYPEVARKSKIQGMVNLLAVIDRAGIVKRVEVQASEPEDYEPFIESAVEAIRQWRYEPATLDGKPVDVYFTVEIHFKLDDSKKDV